MKIEFDTNKSIKNEYERKLSFSLVTEFEWETALVTQDLRKNYPEPRYIASGFIDGRLHILCFTPIKDGIRVISFRKANPREVRNYEAETINKQKR